MADPRKTGNEPSNQMKKLREEYNLLKRSHEKEIESLNKTKEELLLSESKLHALINNREEAIWSLDKDYRLIVCNDFFSNSYKAAYNIDLSIGLNLVKILTPALKRFWKPKYDAALNGKKLRFEFDEKIQGVHFSFEVFLNPIYADGEVVGVSASSVDITERKQWEVALNESEEKYRSAFQTSPDAIAISTFDGEYIDVNEGFSSITGYSRDEVIGENIRELGIWVNPEGRVNFLKKIKEKGFVYNLESEFRKKDGSVITGLVSANIITLNDQPHILSITRDIEDRKKYEEALKESEERYRKFMENNEAIIMTVNPLNGEILFVNDAAVKFYGWEKEKMIGMNINHVNTLAPDQIKKRMLEARKKKQNYFVFQHRLSDGSIRDVEVYQSKLYLKEQEIFSLIIHDITERRKAEEQLRLLGRAIDQNPVSIIITDRDGHIEYVNPKFTEITGYTYEEAIGENPRIMKSGEHTRLFYEELWNTITAGKDWQGEFHNRKKNGDHYWESAVISPVLDVNGKLTHFVAVKEDITEKKKILHDLVKAKNQAEESDRLKSAFLANMSHEIRTPMNGILGFAELLREPDLDGDRRKEFLDIIERSGNRMLGIINDIVDISKIEAGLMELNIKTTDVNKQIEFVTDFFKPDFDSQGLDCKISLGLNNDLALVETDPDKLYAILMNLIKNSIKFTDKGAISIGYSPRGEYLEFYVKDTGIGIPDEKKNLIFERFRQGSESLDRSYEGTGLGLSICKSYITMLGGEIWVESVPGKGSEFYFTIPYAQTGAEDSEKTSGKLIEKTEIKPQKMKILIVEDDEASEKYLGVILKGPGNELIVVTSGKEAVEVCRKTPDLDLILMDIKLPGMHGYEATRQIREFNKDIVIIAQTAYAMPGDRDEAIEAGCNDYISKPIRRPELEALIKKHLGR